MQGSATRIENLSLSLQGTTASACTNCADRLRERLGAVPGIAAVRVDSPTATVQISYDPLQVDPSLLTREAETIAERLARDFSHKTYRLGGMDCAHCAQSIETGVTALPGVASAVVNFPASLLRVERTGNTEDWKSVETRVRDLGFSLTDTAHPEPEKNVQPRLFSDTLRVATAGTLIVVGLLLDHLPALHAPVWLPDTLFITALLLSGYKFAFSGVRALKTGTIGTNLLMAVATVGAVILGHYEEAAGVAFLYAVGEALEGAAMARTRKSLRSLLEAAPPEAVLEAADGTLSTVPATTVKTNGLVLIRPGEKVPTDGVIVSGLSAIAEAAITGESLPREKQVGDTVYAGSLNGDGVLRVRTTATGEDTTVARILHLVEEAQAQKAPVQAVVEKFGRVYTPLVLIAAVLIALLGPLFVPGIDWIYRALTLLVVACPCALVVATPVAYVCGIARAARSGVLVKGGIYLEALATARHIALDKTGTLTTGQLAVTAIHPINGISENELLARVTAVEATSSHPLARAVVRAAHSRDLCVPPLTAVTAVPGLGLRATDTAGQAILVGSARLLTENNILLPTDLLSLAENATARGESLLFFAQDRRVLGVLTVADTLRPEAQTALTDLKRLGLQITVLTGDNARVAQAIAAPLGITDIRADLLPDDKLNAVNSLNATHPTIFVGDGINDAPALAAAAVGVAMGAGGTAAALEAADIALMQSDLARLPNAIRLARMTRNVVRQNVALSVIAVLVLLVATFAGWLPLPVGVLAHEGSALLVIANGLRLLSPKLVPA